MSRVGSGGLLVKDTWVSAFRKAFRVQTAWSLVARWSPSHICALDFLHQIKYKVISTCLWKRNFHPVLFYFFSHFRKRLTVIGNIYDVRFHERRIWIHIIQPQRLKTREKQTGVNRGLPESCPPPVELSQLAGPLFRAYEVQSSYSLLFLPAEHTHAAPMRIPRTSTPR